MKRIAALLVLLGGSLCAEAEIEPVYPGKSWATKTPDEVNLDEAKLKEIAAFARGSGCVVRHGYLVYTWGDAARRGDVASAAKPIYSHFLFKAVEEGLIPSFDQRVCTWESRLRPLNKKLKHKDQRMTWRHLAFQTACYGLANEPGTAFDYNDWQMALFWDLLFKKVYGAEFDTVDAKVLHPKLTDPLQCEDSPTFMAFGTGDRAGRTAISPRDFARFGLLYLRGGKWKDQQLISEKSAKMAVTSPLPLDIPRTMAGAAEMIEGQRSIGSRRIPDNQCDHVGSYSWLWWTNGIGRDGKYHWPDVPPDAYGCFGHGGMRAMVVIPRLDLIISWNDTKIEGAEKENHALGLLVQAVTGETVRLAKAPPRRVAMWRVAESNVYRERPEYSGNPFDVEAMVTFRHAQTGRERRTAMFYREAGTWGWRFTPTLPGFWTYRTESKLEGLDGDYGTFEVVERKDPMDRGFLTHVKNKFAIQGREETDLHGYVFTTYMGRVEHAAFLDEFGDNLDGVRDKTEAYMAEARANGFETIFVHVNNNWFKFGARGHHEHDSVNPDPRCFDVLETIIRRAYDAGGRVHVWAWGDESRKWTPRGLPGGVNGEADRRLQRYIAARLGPIPGWTMGYGFDLHEWTTSEQLNSWARYMHENMGWQHLLCARGFRLDGPFNMNSYDGFGRNVQIATTSHGPKDFGEIVDDLDGDKTRPHFYEERHSYKRDGFDLDMDGTRRLLWRETMAGGMGGFFGFYPDSPHPYPNPEQLRTHHRFWHDGGRFVLDMERAEDLVEGGHALRSTSTNSAVLYTEDATQVAMDLSDYADQAIIAVDAKRPYAQMDLGKLGGGKTVWNAPRESDWAIAVGDFASGEGRRGPMAGQIIVDPADPRWLRRAGGGALMMCGPGDPEDFLYRGKLNADGTRDGDQMELIEKLKPSGANCIYLMAVRSHGGDGDKTHNPFVDHDPSKALNPNVLDQWETWFAEMDDSGIVIYLFIYDDSARVWNTGDEVGEPERVFLRGLVNRFKHHRNLIWCIAEEYGERLSAERVRRIAAVIREADNFEHVIAVHKNHGLDFSEFADDPNIDQFAVQYNVQTRRELHTGMVKAFQDAAGRYHINMSEAADFGGGAEARKKSWACAMAGAHVMILRMDIATTPAEELIDCGRLVRFFESIDLAEMAPRDELAHGGTEYVLAEPGERYVAYASALQGRIGLKDMKVGKYRFRWFDCTSGRQVTQDSIAVEAGDQTWERPAGIGGELAVYIRRSW